MAIQNIIPIVQSVISQPDAQMPAENLDIAQYISVSEVSESVFSGTNSAPLNSNNVHAVQSVSSGIFSAQTRFRTHIGDLEGFMAAPSGYWKLTMIMGTGENGHSESHVVGPSLTLNQAITAAEGLANVRATLLGSNQTLGNQTTSRGNASIPYIRISDAFNPRNTLLRDYSASPWFGYPSPNNSGADVGSVAISQQLRATNENDGVTIVSPTLGILFQPDKVMLDGNYNGTNVSVTSSLTWHQAYSQYCNYLANAANKLGCLGQAVAVPKKVATGCVLDTDNLFKFTCAAHGYASGSKIRITSANNPAFNMTTKIISMDANTIKLAKVLPIGLLPFSLAKVQLLQLPTGVRTQEFYKYSQFTILPKYRARKIAKAFSPISFRRRRRI